MSTRYAVTKHFKRVNYPWEVYRLDETGGYTGEAVARCQDAKMAQLIAELLTRSAADPNVYYQMAHAGRDLI